MNSTRYSNRFPLKNLLQLSLIIFFPTLPFVPVLALEKYHANPQGEFIVNSGKSIKVSMAISPREQSEGLSSITDRHFAKNEGLLFLYQHSGPRKFWMPDTHMNLDIFFLDQNLKIVHITRDLKKHPGKATPPAIESTPLIHSLDVLEMRSDSELAKSINENDILIWKGPKGLNEIRRDTRRQQ